MLIVSEYDNLNHGLRRELMLWGTYGINGDQPLKLVKISEMDTAHLQACIDTQFHMLKEYKETMATEIIMRSI